MTSRERLHAAMTGNMPDKIPISPRISVYLIDRFGDCNPKTELKYAHEHDYDMHHHVSGPVPAIIEGATSDLPYTKNVKIDIKTWQENEFTAVRRIFHTPSGVLSDTTMLPPKKPEYGVSPNPFKTEWLIKEKNDLDKMAYILPEAEKCGSVKYYYDTDAIIGDNGITEMAIRGSIDKRAGDARGMDNLMMDYYDDREFFDAQINFFMKYVMDETKFCLEKDIKYIFGTWFYTSLSAGWSPKIFRECFIPQMKMHVDLVHSYDAIYNLYDDGKMSLVLEDYASTGTDVLQTLTPPPVGDVVLANVKKRIGDKVTLMGHMDLIYVMLLGTPDEVEKAVKDAISIAGPGGRFILGTTDSIREGTPEANMKAYFKTANKYRYYPLQL